MNDLDRCGWVNNDESLYLWWKTERIGLYRFVRENRRVITEFILKVISKER